MSKNTDFQINHDKIFKLAFKNKDRFKQLLKFALGSKKFSVIAGDQIEFIDTELLKKDLKKFPYYHSSSIFLFVSTLY